MSFRLFTQLPPPSFVFLLAVVFSIVSCMEVNDQKSEGDAHRQFHEGGTSSFGLPQEENEPFQKCRGELECNSRPRLKRIAPHEQQYAGVILDATSKEPFRNKNFDLILYRRDYDSVPAATFHYVTDSNGRFESGRIAFARGRRVRVCIKDQVQLRNSDGTVANVVYDGTACFPRYSEEALQTSARVAVSDLGQLSISRDYFSAYDTCPTFPTVIPGGSIINNCRKDDTQVNLIVCDREGADDPARPPLTSTGIPKLQGECRTIPNAQIELSFRQNSNSEPMKLNYTTNSGGRLISDLIASVRNGFVNVKVTADGYLPYFSGDAKIPNSKGMRFGYKKYRVTKRGVHQLLKGESAVIDPILLTRNDMPHGAITISPLRQADSQGIYTITNAGDSFFVGGYAVDDDYSGNPADGRKVLYRVIHNGQIVLERYTDRTPDLSCRVGANTCPGTAGFGIDLMSELNLVEGLNQVYIRAFNEEGPNDRLRPGATKEQRFTDLGDFDNEFSVVSPLLIYRQPLAATYETQLLNVYANTAFIRYKRMGSGAADFLTLKLCEDQFGFLSNCRDLEIDFEQGAVGEPDLVKVVRISDLVAATKYVVSTKSKINSEFDDISFETAASAPSIGSIAVGEILAEGTRATRVKIVGTISNTGLVVPGVELTLMLRPRSTSTSSKTRVLIPIVRHFRVASGQTGFTVADLVLPTNSSWEATCYQSDYTTCGQIAFVSRPPRR